MDDKFKTKFAQLFGEVQKEVNQTAHEKGWYDCPIMAALRQLQAEGADITEALNRLDNLYNCARIGLMHSELSEALEGLRHGNPPSDKIGNLGFTQAEEEFADTVIRMQDTSEENGWRLGEAIEAKRLYNSTRPYRHGGKKL